MTSTRRKPRAKPDAKKSCERCGGLGRLKRRSERGLLAENDSITGAEIRFDIDDCPDCNGYGFVGGGKVKRRFTASIERGESSRCCGRYPRCECEP